MPSRPIARHSGHRQVGIRRFANAEKWQRAQKWRTRTPRGSARRCPQRTSVARGSKPAALINAAHSGPCGRTARPDRSHTTTWAASWAMISRSVCVSRDMTVDPISSTSLGGTHRATVDRKRTLNAICKRETRPCLQTFASVASCARPTLATRSLTLTPVGPVVRRVRPVGYSLRSRGAPARRRRCHCPPDA